MKNLKKLFLLLSIILVTISCSKDDGPIKGCMDPLAANYNSAAEESDGSCQYSFVGNWYLSKYIVNSQNALLLFKDGDVWLDVTSSNSYDLWGELISTGEFISSKGTLATSGDNNSTLTLSNNDGSVSTFTITQINGSSVSFNGTNYGDNEDITIVKL